MNFRALIGTQDSSSELSVFQEDCAALLSGRLLDRLFASGRYVPHWAWVNKLTHASQPELEAFAENPGSPEQRPDLWVWQRTTAFLAGEVLHSARQSGNGLYELQRSCLLPIELCSLEQPVGPSTMLRVILSALAEKSAR